MPGLLRSLWDEPRPAAAPRRVWRDWALLAVLVAVAVVETVVRTDLPARPLGTVAAVAVMPTLLWRRTHPLAMLAIAFAGCALAPVLTGGADPGLYAGAYLLIMPYALTRWGSGREVLLGLPVVFGRLGLAAAIDEIGLGEALMGLFVLTALLALGAAARYRAGSRLRELEQARLLERERLARDLHDTVAHHVSAMAIRAQAGIATAANDPAAAVGALHVIEAEASRALAEMRAMVRVLRRTEPAELSPAPRVADLTGLAGAKGGPVVEVELTGDVDGLPPTVGSAIYRLAQESVTNARRHAKQATRVTVQVTVGETAVHLRVSDDGAATTARAAASPGYGLVGMIERAGLLGGTCEAGPGPGRGWTVTAVLPRTGSAA